MSTRDIQTYRAKPNELTKQGEDSKWQRFIKVVVPWGIRKFWQGERFFDSKVKIQESQARLNNANALKAEAETMKIMYEIGEEKEKLEEKEVIEINHEEILNDKAIEEELSRLKGKIKLFELKYGLSIDIGLHSNKSKISELLNKLNSKSTEFDNIINEPKGEKGINLDSKGKVEGN